MSSSGLLPCKLPLNPISRVVNPCCNRSVSDSRRTPEPWERAMRRRDLIKGIAGSIVWPFAARAQQPAMPIVGFLAIQSSRYLASHMPSFRQGLKEAGYIEGQSVAIEYRLAEGHYDRLPDMLADLNRSSGSDDRYLRHRSIEGSKSSHNDAADRFHNRRRSGHGRARREPQSPGRQYHGASACLARHWRANVSGW